MALALPTYYYLKMMINLYFWDVIINNLVSNYHLNTWILTTLNNKIMCLIIIFCCITRICLLTYYKIYCNLYLKLQYERVVNCV